MLFSGVRSNNNLNIDVCYEIKRLNNIETNKIIYLNHESGIWVSQCSYVRNMVITSYLILHIYLLVYYSLHYVIWYSADYWSFLIICIIFPHNIMWECGIFEMLHILDFPRTNHDLSSFHSIHKSISMQCVKIAWKAQYVYK